MTTKFLERFNWPQPLKYAHLLKPKHLELKLTARMDCTQARGTCDDLEPPPQMAHALEISSDALVKGFLLGVVEWKLGD